MILYKKGGDKMTKFEQTVLSIFPISYETNYHGYWQSSRKFLGGSFNMVHDVKESHETYQLSFVGKDAHTMTIRIYDDMNKVSVSLGKREGIVIVDSIEDARVKMMEFILKYVFV